MKKFIVFFSTPLIISFFVSIFYHFSLIKFLNTIFILGSILFIFSGFSLLYEKKAFSIVRYSFKKFFSIFSRISAEDLTENKKIDLKDFLKTKKYDYTLPLFIASINLVILSIIVSFIMF